MSPEYESCPNCGLNYNKFRTGLTFSDARSTFWRHVEPWHSKRRHSVLGRWHEIKLEMWKEHVSNCHQIEEEVCYGIEEY